MLALPGVCLDQSSVDAKAGTCKPEYILFEETGSSVLKPLSKFIQYRSHFPISTGKPKGPHFLKKKEAEHQRNSGADAQALIQIFLL